MSAADKVANERYRTVCTHTAIVPRSKSGRYFSFAVSPVRRSSEKNNAPKPKRQNHKTPNNLSSICKTQRDSPPITPYSRNKITCFLQSVFFIVSPWSMPAPFQPVCPQVLVLLTL